MQDILEQSLALIKQNNETFESDWEEVCFFVFSLVDHIWSGISFLMWLVRHGFEFFPGSENHLTDQ
jgi:hypothetical protein